MFEYEAEEKKKSNIDDGRYSHFFFFHVSPPHCLEVIKYSSDTNIYSVSYSLRQKY